MHPAVPFCLLLTTVIALAAPSPTPVRLEANRGQTHPDVQFLARPQGQQVFLTAQGFTFHTATGDAITLSFPNARPAQWQPEGPVQSSISYFLGNDPAKWVHAAPLYDRILWRSAWPGIDIAVYGAGNRLEYDFLTAPGADLSPLRLKITATHTQPALLPDGTIAAGPWRHRTPLLYQQPNRPIPGSFEPIPNRPGEFRLRTAAYDRSQPLIIDPVIELASYLGGEAFDEITAVGEGWVAGHTRSIAFPTPQFRRSQDIFLRGTGSLAPNGRQFGTVVLGGSGDDELAGVHVTLNAQEILVAGTTRSRDLPLGSTILLPSTFRGGTSDGFVTVLQFTRAFFPSITRTDYVGGSGADRLAGVVGTSFRNWVVAGTTDSPDLPVPLDTPSSLAGETDIFYTDATGAAGYIGGKAADTARGILLNGRTLFLCGETRSPDFPFSSDSLSGPSDGVLIEFPSGVAFPSVVHRIGGSGEDAITALSAVFPEPRFGAQTGAQRLVLAGTTSSPDLPAAPTTFAGATDAFAASWNLTTAKLDWLRYLGGSGHDEALALAQNPAGDLYLGGVTRSTDFALTAPLQPQPGGGSEDGWFAMLESDGVFRHVSYYGGYGDDRVLSIHAANDVARLGGRTTSPGLPQFAPLQSAFEGDADGFLADIRPDYILGRPELILARDGVLYLSLGVPGNSGAAVTYRSSDVTRVRLSTRGTSGAEVTSDGGQVNVEGLAETGEAELIASSPGFPDKRIRVRLFPGAFTLPATPASPLLLWSSALPLQPVYAAYDPATGQVLATMPLRNGIPPPRLTLTSSHPNILEIEQFPFNPISARPRAVGQAVVELTAEGLPTIGATRTFTVAPPFVIRTPLRLGRDLQTAFAIPLDSTLTIRSEDPSRLVISTSSDIAGQGELSRIAAPVVYLQALAGSGTVRVLLSSPAFPEPLVLPVTLEEPVLAVGSLLPPANLTSEHTVPGPGSVLSLEPIWRLPGSTAFFMRRPDAPEVTVRLHNSAPRVVQLNRLTLSPLGGTLVSALAPGTAELDILTQPGDIPLAFPRITVRVGTPPYTNLNLPSLLAVGQDLQAAVSLPLNTSVVTVRSADPSAALIAVPGLPPSAQATVPVNSGTAAFFVQGLRAGASTQLHLETATGDSGVLPVEVIASGPALALSGDHIDISTVAIHAPSRAALAPQSLRPGVNLDVQLRTEGAIQTATTQVTLNAANPSARVAFTATGPGRVIAEPSTGSGFVTARTSTVTVNESAATLSPFRVFARSLLLLHDEQQAVRLAAPKGARVTSSNPALLRVTHDSNLPGVDAVTLDPGTLLFFVQALASEGEASLHLTSPGEPDIDVPVRFAPPYLSLNSANVTMAPGSSLSVDFLYQPSSRRPGAPPLRSVAFQSSHPDVLTVGPVPDSPFNFARVPITAVTEGIARLTVISPANLRTLPESVWIRVSRIGNTGFTSAYTLGRDLQAGLELPVSPPPPAGATLTITSSDPAKLRLSRSPQSEGADSVTVAVLPGTTATQRFYLQALAADGVVQLLVSGYPLATVRLSSTILLCDPPNSFLTPGGTQPLDCSLRPAGATQGTFSELTLRPGTAPPSLRVESSDPNVLKASPEALAFNGIATRTIVSPVSPGRATLRITSASHIIPSPEAIPYTVAAPPITSCGLSTLTYLTRFFCPFAGGRAIPATITVDDPDLLTVTTTSTPTPGLLFDALSHFNTTEVRLQAPGYADLLLPVVLQPLTLFNPQPQRTVNAGQESFIDLRLSGETQLSPGASIAVTATSSNPAIASVDPTTTLTSSNTRVRFRANAPGIATITLMAEGVVFTPAVVAITAIASVP